jgi:hypothetical protein
VSSFELLEVEVAADTFDAKANNAVRKQAVHHCLLEFFVWEWHKLKCLTKLFASVKDQQSGHEKHKRNHTL